VKFVYSSEGSYLTVSLALLYGMYSTIRNVWNIDVNVVCGVKESMVEWRAAEDLREAVVM
jgi:hypothetical protein